jgi:hypothetical protein
MASPRKARVDESFGTRVWSDIEPAVRSICGDTAVCVCLLLGLTIIYLYLGWMAGLGYDPARIEIFEDLHYWASLVVLGVFLLSFVIRMAVFALKPRS